MGETTQQAGQDMGSAIMEAFRILREDQIVETAKVGSERRRGRIASILEAVAPRYGVTAQDLGRTMAEMLKN